MFDVFKRIFLGNASKIKPLYFESEAELVLLNEFMKPKDAEKVIKYWPPEKSRLILRNLIQRGELIQPPITKRLDVAYKLADLKAFLKQMELPTSGVKAVLIDRIISSEVDLIKIVSDSIYECSSDARTRVENWLDQRHAAEIAAIHEIIDLLKSGKVEDACHISSEYKKFHPTKWNFRDQNNPIGIEIPKKDIINLINIILVAKPKILADLSEDDLEIIRLAVAIWQLGFTGQGIDIAMDGYVGTSRFRPERVRMLLYFYARHIENIEDLRKYWSEVTLSIVQGCESCKSFDGKIVNLNDVPEFPNPNCLGDGCTSIFSSPR